ncbi:L,D-transpeptidase [Streptomyces sp. RKND-216]|uniref:L,D-transpeptidase n=1 Tax=Streptomyces sp. RKND-216 TaxID=2562581 RepID=UPI00109DCDCF|nr:Ig-like domain-containing protein [Streptomyces sp. RKND-216]THA26807.1 L,D-transpeptidase [Streptomyces sp. RKND-216]
MTDIRKRRTAVSCALLLGPLAVGLTACGEDGHPLAAAPYDAGSQVELSAEDGSDDVDYRKPLVVTAEDDEALLTDVVATDAGGRHVRGRLSEDGTRWHSTAPLAAGTRYTVRVSTENEDGEPGRRTVRFGTRPSDGKKFTVTFGPEKGEYGVGQPLVAELSHKVKGREQRETVERALNVRSTPRAQGGWHWVDAQTLHYRPKEYWPSHASISVSAALEGIKIRDGLRGGVSKPLSIRTDDRVEGTVDLAAHTLTVTRDGEEARTIPISAGKPGFRTRVGVKVILGKTQFLRMTSGSIGIPAGSSESYDLPVYWNARLTHSGEFLHAAPWSSGSQGIANTSHGCTGMSTENAKWLFGLVQKGDVFTYVNGDGGEQMPAFGNGFGDWNLSWSEWREGSALTGEGKPAQAPLGDIEFAQARLRFQA